MNRETTSTMKSNFQSIIILFHISFILTTTIIINTNNDDDGIHIFKMYMHPYFYTYVTTYRTK